MGLSLSDSDSSPAPSPPKQQSMRGSSSASRGSAASKPASRTGAAPKSAKTVQTARARPAVESDDSDGEDSGLAVHMRQMLAQFAEESEKKKKKLEKGSQKARADFETKVQGTIQDFDDSLKQEMTAHQQQCNKVARLMSEYLKKVKAAEEAVQQKTNEFNEAAASLTKRTKKDVAAIGTDTLPKGKAAVAAANKGVARIKGISKKYQEQHTKAKSISFDWARLARDVAAVGEKVNKQSLGALNDVVANA